MRVLNRLSIRARITLGSVVIAAVVFGAGLVVVRANVGSILESSDRTLVLADLVPPTSEIARKPDGPIDDSGKGSLLLVKAPDGSVQLDTLPDDISRQVARLPASDEEFTTSVDGAEFIVVGREVKGQAGTWALWAARSTDSSDLAAAGFDRVLVTGGLVLLVLFGLASWFLGTAALRPVTRMRRQAENLSGAEGAAGLPVGPARDELAALATTLNAFLDRVRRSTAREKQVVSDAAHELRTPLAALKTQLELTHTHLRDPEALAREIASAERSVERLSALATNLLALSRLEAGESANESSSGEELVSELMDAIDRSRLVALPRKVDVSFSSAVLEPEQRYALSASSFSRIIDNLSSNAIAAVTSGGSVSIALSDENGLLVEVTDDGPGMPDGFLEHAFDRFSRVDSSRTGATGGSGLGLALVRAITESAGGTTSIENLAPGLRVRVAIPNM